MNTYAKGEKIKYPTITEDMLENIEDENSSYTYRLSKSQFDLAKCIGCPYISIFDMLLSIIYVEESNLGSSYSYSLFDGHFWLTINTQITIESIDDDYYGIILEVSMLQSPFGTVGTEAINISDKIALIESVKEQPEVEISEQAKTNFKTNMDISDGSAYSEVNHGTADTTFTLTPNTFHVWGEVASLTLDFGSETNGVANEYLFQFTSGATATSLTLPDDIKWANNKIPTIVENMIYQVSILKGLASILEFSNTSDTVE